MEEAAVHDDVLPEDVSKHVVRTTFKIDRYLPNADRNSEGLHSSLYRDANHGIEDTILSRNVRVHTRYGPGIQL